MGLIPKRTYKPLDEIIDSSGLKKSVIAERLGVDYSTFYHWRVKPSSISAIELGKLSNILGVDFLSLLEVIKKFGEEHDKMAS